MKPKTPQTNQRPSQVTQWEPPWQTLLVGDDRAVYPEDDGREVSEGVDEFGDVWRVGVVGLAPVDGGGVVAPVWKG